MPVFEPEANVRNNSAYISANRQHRDLFSQKDVLLSALRKAGCIVLFCYLTMHIVFYGIKRR